MHHVRFHVAQLRPLYQFRQWHTEGIRSAGKSFSILYPCCVFQRKVKEMVNIIIQTSKSTKLNNTAMTYVFIADNVSNFIALSIESNETVAITCVCPR